MFKRKFVILIWLTLISGYAYAKPPDVVIKSSLDKFKISLDDTVRFKIEISAALESNPKIKLPSLKPEDFDIISSSQSKNVALKNGIINYNIIYNYLLLPKREGKIEIGEVTLTYKGQVYKSDKLELEVAPAKNPQNLPVNPQEGIAI